jgi:hypothetical protein
MDFADLSFFIYIPPTGDINAMYNKKPSIPLPIVALATTGVFFASIFGIRRGFLDIKMVCKKCWLIAVLFVLLSLIPFLLLGVSILTFVQVYMGLLLVSSVSFIVNRQYLDEFAKSYLYGVFIWLFFHVLSMLYYNDFSPIGIERNWNFSTFFGIYVYQSQVSYAASLSVFFIFSIFMYVEKKSSLIALGSLFLSGFVGFVSDTRLFVVDYLLIMTMMIFFYRSSKRTYFIGKRKAAAVMCGLIIMFFGMTYYANRFITKGSLDRVELISMGLNEIIENPSLIFWGAGLKHSYAHNYFIDFIINYGLLNLLLVMSVFLYSLLGVINRLDLPRNGLVYCFILGAVVITNSIFNSAITQPLFICNLMLVLTFVISYMSGYVGRHLSCSPEKEIPAKSKQSH